MVQVEGLKKSYGDFEAVRSVSFEARAGEIFGLLGPNGAGKTTTIHCITGLLKPSGGTIRIGGREAWSAEARARIGVVPQEVALYDDLTARENLAFWGGVQRMRGAALKSRIDAVLELTGLQDRASEPVKGYSGGMKRRLNFACGVVHEPKVLLLDEPTVGVDPQSRVRLLELVRAQAAAGAAVIYTTHYMEEAEQLCDRLAVMDHGRMIAEGTLEELRASMKERDLLRLGGLFDEARVREALMELGGIEVHHCDGSEVLLSMSEAPARLSAIFSALSGAGAEVKTTTLKQPSLETLFVKLTGKDLRE